MNEDHIYTERRERHRLFRMIFLCLVALGGLLGGLYYLRTLPPEPPVTVSKVFHSTCSHPGCQQSHDALVAKTFSDGTGGALLVVVYLIFCSVVVVSERSR